MLTKQSKDQKGFTIIEVLIVLAIAGLILLIVFLAVPALQRNSRNTQRKNDVAAILAAVAEFSNNNNGTLPDSAVAWANTGGTLTVNGAAGTSSTEAKVGYYNTGIGAATGNVNKVATGTATPAGTLNAANLDYAKIATGTVCSGVAAVAGPARSITAVYEIENGNASYTQQCQSS